MFWFHLKWFVWGRWFIFKKQVYCRFFHRHDRCYPEVWDRGLDGPWHCSRCVSCGAAIDYWLERLHAEKKEKNS